MAQVGTLMHVRQAGVLLPSGIQGPKPWYFDRSEESCGNKRNGAVPSTVSALKSCYSKGSAFENTVRTSDESAIPSVVASGGSKVIRCVGACLHWRSRLLHPHELGRSQELRLCRQPHQLRLKLLGDGRLLGERHITGAVSSVLPGANRDADDDDDVEYFSKTRTDGEGNKGGKDAALELVKAAVADGGVAPPQASTKKSRRKLRDRLPPESLILVFSCIIGLMVGAGVVAFNLLVHEIHDFAWEGVPESGATWLRSQPLQDTWLQLLLVPTGGGVVVGFLNFIRMTLESGAEEEQANGRRTFLSSAKAVGSPTLKAVAAAVTLGTGNSLGPEGPSVEIGATIATGVSSALGNSRERKLAMVASGSAAGISSGFNAAVAGCFFAVESVLRNSQATSGSLTTAMILLGSVLASVVSQAGLGSDPAFKIPAYDFCSPAELPLYLLLGLFCGGVSIALTRGSLLATQAFDHLKTTTGIHPALLPPIGGLSVGIIALAYPEILYWGWTNVDIILESRPSSSSLPTVLLLQLVGVKIVATSICRGSGLVGGVYAPSIFIGAALGAAYGRLAVEALAWVEPTYDLTWLTVSAPQAYAMVGMAATLAGVCQVPLTSVLLLFELTRDYRIILPLMGAVGLSAWLASTANKKPKKVFQPAAATGPTLVQPVAMTRDGQATLAGLTGASQSQESQEAGKMVQVGGMASSALGQAAPMTRLSGVESVMGVGGGQELCVLDESLCVSDDILEEEELLCEILVATAMRTNFAAVDEEVTVRDSMAVMMGKKEWCCLVLGPGRTLQGLLTLADIQQEAARLSSGTGNPSVTDIRKLQVKALTKRRANRVVTVPADATLEAAVRMMTPRGLRQLPVLAASDGDNTTGAQVIGVLDREGISLACRAEATRRLLASLPKRGSSGPAETNGAVRSQSL